MKEQLKYLFLALIALLFVFSPAAAQTEVQSPTEYLGYELGSRWTPHDKVMGYFKYVAETSPMVQLQQYGTTYEGRKLILATVSSVENMDRKEEIRTNNLKRAGLLQGEPTEDTTAIVWLSYNVHGNEPSSSEAAMKTLYELVRPDNAQSKGWLRNTMVLIDPMLNPDGRDRYVYWYKEVAGIKPNPHINAREHHEPWPGGRTNHYYFDLNRDWAWLTQKETRQRNEVFQSWLPQVHVDFHEQGYNSPYYFAPAAEPFHDAITDWQREFQYTIGKNHARYFDENNWLYFTREIFDLFYPGYGDTYPIFNGSIGMTYEQAGHSQAGLSVIQADGDTLTLHERILHHYTTGMSTIEVVSEHAWEVVDHFATYYRNSRENPQGQYKTYVIKGDNNPDKLRALFRFLDQHNVKYGKAPANQSYRGYDYFSGETEQVRVSTEDYLVSAYQPKSVLARIFFEPDPELSDSLTYDITAWGQFYAFGLQGYALTERVNPVPAEAPALQVDNNTSGTPYAYLADWKSEADLKLLTSLLNKNIKLRFARKEFTIDGQDYSPGTLIITRNGNEGLGRAFDEMVQHTADSLGRQLHPAYTGFAESGPDFGSETVNFLKKPRVALLSGKGTTPNSVGEVWYFFDNEIHYPLTLIDTDYFDGVDLDKYDVIVMPDGYYGTEISNERLDDLKEWVRVGGRLIILQGANSYFLGKDDFGLQVKEDEQAPPPPSPPDSFNERRLQNIRNINSGSIFRITMDPTHPLAYGYDKTYFSLKLDANAYKYIEDGWNVGITGENAHISGFVGSDAEKLLANTLTFGVRDMGKGKVVYMIDNPLFRGFWHNGKLLFGNAVFMVGQ